uniref:Uncharacterized protein n=1 Tax=Molossus molossus TaxID=27622 RepID=A0A7J8GQJ8_MOLMO|nr:hypothetical protein HJG59_011239 [Molossus molossus]
MKTACVGSPSAPGIRAGVQCEDDAGPKWLGTCRLGAVGEPECATEMTKPDHRTRLSADGYCGALPRPVPCRQQCVPSQSQGGTVCGSLPRGRAVPENAQSLGHDQTIGNVEGVCPHDLCGSCRAG